MASPFFILAFKEGMVTFRRGGAEAFWGAAVGLMMAFSLLIRLDWLIGRRTGARRKRSRDHPPDANSRPRQRANGVIDLANQTMPGPALRRRPGRNKG